MLQNENLWIKATHGLFKNEDPSVFGVAESRVDLAKFPYDINGKNSGFISMNGLVVSSVLAMVRGTYHYTVFENENEGQQKTIWAEYISEKEGNKGTRVYLMKIKTELLKGINYTYTRICSAEIAEYKVGSHEFCEVWTPDEIEKMKFAPALSFIPAIIASCSFDEEVEKRVTSLSHLPENKYDGNPNLYWLSQYFFDSRSEFYSKLDDLTLLKMDDIEPFVNKHLENLIGWEFRDLYNSSVDMSFGNISMEQLAEIFSSEDIKHSELGQLIPSIDLSDYYIDPKIKAIVDLLVLERDTAFPINTGMLYGPPASGKSTAVMLMAKMLNLPYVPVTFNSNISMDDLLGSWQPTEDGKIHFVESTFVQAYQMPSVVEFVECYYVKPGACGDLNTALDETAQITLPNGKIIYRNPACFIVATINAGENENEYRAVREQDVSFDRRFEGFKEYLDFFKEDVFAEMIQKKSGYDDLDEILLMIKVMKDMNKGADETGDWQTIYPSAVMRWAQHRKYKDIITAARSTILPAASKNLEIQREITDSILNNYW